MPPLKQAFCMYVLEEIFFKAVGERQTQLNMEKQKMLEERSSLQASLESLHQEVLQLTRLTLDLCVLSLRL